MMRLTRPTSFSASSSASASSLLPRFASSIASSSRLFSKSAEPVVASSACTPLAPPDYTTGIQFVAHRETFPVYRIMDDEGEVLDAAQLPEVGQELTQKMYKNMVTLNVMDGVLYDAQRQGRISFYMTASGEEATHVGSASVLDPEDVIYAQYREAGVLMWRGFTIADFMNQCFSNELDMGKGRQMPVHYGSRRLNFQTISSPLGTQIPQAAGTGYALKLAGRSNVCICYFGEGAASEGDFHPALNFAATLRSPTIFFCRNNGYAISTPVKEQYAGDGIAGRGPGYGVATVRVDGNDVWAVYNVTKAARKIALEENRPVLIEAMTYRVGHHSTSDDSSAYRSKEEVQSWAQNNNPISRLRKFMEKRGWWSQEQEDEIRKAARKEVLEQLKLAEQRPKPHVDELFTDVYDSVPKHLQEQKAELEAMMRKYPDHYTAASH